VTSFPLYTEAIRFAHHGEKMIQTAIRSLTLSIYNGMKFLIFSYVELVSQVGILISCNRNLLVVQLAMIWSTDF